MTIEIDATRAAEHDAHLYFRRAKTTEALFGSSAQHRALLADRVGL